MPLSSSEIQKLLTYAFPDAHITLEDLAGDDDHFALRLVSPLFEGKNRVARHRAVYEALEGRVGETLHALSITALTPNEADKE